MLFLSGTSLKGFIWLQTKSYFLTHSCPSLYILAVAPPMNLQVHGVTDRSIDIEWEGSSAATDYLITYSSTSPDGVQLELRVQGKVTNTTICKLLPGLEYNINVYTVIDEVISVPVSTLVSTCELLYYFIVLNNVFFYQITS